jgi:peptide deformylase
MNGRGWYFAMGRIKTSELQILLYPHPALRRACDPVEAIEDGILLLADRMLNLMHEARGVGLAAPQVGSRMCLFVCNPSGDEGDDRVYINPRLVETSGVAEHEEGCLSIPDVTVTMRRAARVVLEAVDEHGAAVRREAVDLEARVFQHEIDHLNGKLIIDNMSATDEMANRKAVKKLEHDASDAKRL